ncbi:MAG: hypothetical protein GY710_27205 [Desulfobacteraceae bacterium]|nr:hypothetical protein [Desulfobacteraceae bacterium]
MPWTQPEPIDAIKFRMEQIGLNQQGLVPFVGSKSKVSEILNKKRPLTFSMMRSLHQNLGIPAEVFLQKTGDDFPKAIPHIEWYLFPLKEMSKRGKVYLIKDITQKVIINLLKWYKK